MANHVFTNINIKFETAKDSTKFLEWIAYLPENDMPYLQKMETCNNCMLDSLYEDKQDSYDYFIENIGAKWISIDDIDHNDNEVDINWTSAWSFADKLFIKLSNHVIEQFPEALLHVTYEDEGFGFVGAAYMSKLGYDLDEYDPEIDHDSDEFFDQITDKKQELLKYCMQTVNELA